MSRDDVAKAVLGQLPAALAETVSLATPLTMSRIEGRDEAAAVLRELAESLGIGEPEFIADDDERAFVTFVGTGQGREVGLFAVLTRGSERAYSAVDLYARPWPSLMSGSATTSTCRYPTCPPGRPVASAPNRPAFPNYRPTWRSTPRC